MPTIKIEFEVDDELCHFCMGLAGANHEWYCLNFHKKIPCPKNTTRGKVERPQFCRDAEKGGSEPQETKPYPNHEAGDSR